MAYVKVADRGLSVEETNGSGKLTRLALQKKLDYYEKAAEACRFILAQFDDARTPSTLDAALHIEKTRAEKKKPLTPFQQKRARGDYWTNEAIKDRRTRTAKFLKAYSMTEPRPAQSGKGFGSLVAAGYLKKSGDGYIRTDKPFVIDAG